MLKSKHPFQLIILAVILVIAGICIGELLWWHNARQSYPRWLVSAAPANANDLTALWKACGSPLEVEPEGTDMALVRCGTYWPMRSIWLVPKDYVSSTPKP